MRNLLARIGYWLGWLLASNNGRCLALWVITGVFLVITIFSGFGKPVLTQVIDKKIYEAPIKSKYHQSVYDAWYAPERAKTKLANKKWPEKRKKEPSLFWTWKWWITFFFFFFISLIYTPIAFREEIREAIEDTWRKIREKEEAEAKEIKTQPGESAPKPTKTAGSTFTKQLSLEFAAEFLAEMAQKIYRRR